MPHRPTSGDRVVVATVRRPHGLRGDLLVEVTTEVPDRLAVGSPLLVVPADGRPRPTRVEEVRSHRLGALVRLAGYDGRDAVEGLRGASLEVESRDVPPAPEGAYYYFDLVGCVCRDRRAGELGRVADVMEDGGGLILRVDDGRREVLIPFVKSYLRSVDVDAGLIELDLPEGLVETCASPS